MLDALVTNTAVVGSGYFQLRENTLNYHARAASGEMPQGAVMEALLAHGLPPQLPLIQALEDSRGVLFFEDTREHGDAAGFPELGVYALIAAPIHDREARLVGALLAHVFNPHPWTDRERVLISAVTGLLSMLAARLDAEERERNAHESALRALGLCLEARDAETQGHTDRVTDMAVRLGRELGLTEADLRALRWGAYLHDIGKIGISDEILRHPDKLTPTMWSRMQEHVQDGVNLARQLPFLPLTALDVISGHHEHWNGAGYPKALSGEDIPLPARIFAVCDVFDALVSVRPYKRAWATGDAVAHIISQSGTHFDPQVVEAFVRMTAQD